MLLAGTGPLQFALANQIVDAGGTVEAIVEAGNIDKWMSLARGAWGQWTLIADAWRYWSGIRKAGIPLWREHIILEARGEGRVEEAVVAQVDPEWRPIPGTERTLAVDTVCVGYGRRIAVAAQQWFCGDRGRPDCGYRRRASARLPHGGRGAPPHGTEPRTLDGSPPITSDLG